MKRECSAVGKTQRALWSWLMRRSRCSQALSRMSSSAASSGASPAPRASPGASRFVELDIAVDRVADQVDGGEAGRSHDPIVRVPGSPRSADRQGTQTDSGALKAPTFPARSRARTRSQ